jgi:uncharacterized membrane protein YccC
MHYALNLRTFFYSHYFYLGLRVAFGVIGLTFLALELSSINIAMTVCVGALCTALMDMPSPLRHKFNEMLAAVLLCSAVTLLISLCGPVHWLMMTMLVLISFLASMMVVYGKKSLPLQVAALFIMTMSMQHVMTARQSFIHAGLFMAGGLAYLAYAMAVSWFLRHRIKQQVLAEALFELAAYIDIKADFYDTRYNLSQQFNKLVRQQGLLADRQQASRDLILRSHQNGKDAIVVQVHVCMLDLYEQILSTHTDYALLRTHLADTDVMRALRDLAFKAARDIESVAYAVTRKRESHARVNYDAELAVIEAEVQILHARAAASPAALEACQVLSDQRNKIVAIIGMIGELHIASQKVQASTPFWSDADMGPFLSQQEYEVRLLLSHLRPDSPVFRFSLRVAMAIAVGLLIGSMMPYSEHSYWIVLTIVIILRPSFSMTKQRRGDRIIGTVIGCVLSMMVLKYVHSPAIIVGILFIATVATPAFIYLRYRYTAIAVSLMILLQMHLIAPDNTHLVGERLLDTLIGAAVASVFSFVLANWEYQSLPRLIRQVLEANRGYMHASFELLQGNSDNDFPYRIERKRLMDNLAALSGALVRMLDEPASKQRAVEDINLFVVQNYLLVAHVAALRSLLKRYGGVYPKEAVDLMLRQGQTQVARTLALALGRQDGSQVEIAAIATPASGSAAGIAAREWQGWPQVQRRIRLLQADADKITVHSAAIVRNIMPADTDAGIPA